MESLFEVHTLKGGQWQIDSTYREREIALDTAKQLYAEKQYQAVKVVKDTFDPRTNASRELVIYDTSKNTAEGPAPRAAAARADPPARPASRPDPEPRRRGRPAPQKSDTSVVLRAVIWLIVILVGGLLIIWGLVNLSYILEQFST